ncbi:MAG TPA: CDP-archaeol synthase [Patescibacteria group bacterium]|nr:CDP-archaeol synthase [Patescibacteria group bacterium]
MLEHIFFAFWFFAPVGLANVSAFFSSKIPILKKYNYPVDFHLKFRKKRILGSHKTIRGFVFGILMAILGVSFQIYLYNHVSFFREIETIDYSSINPILFGFLCGFGALTGDAIKSFFKRRAGLVPGRSWAPFDQIDYILGGIVFTALYIQLAWTHYLLIFILWSIIHPLGTFAGFLVRLRRKPI